MAPAFRHWITHGLSSLGTLSLNATTPLVVARPATSTLIFSVTGTPCSAPSSAPFFTASSARSAAASASSAMRSTIALTRGLTASIRARQLCTASRDEISRARIARASSTAPQRHRSFTDAWYCGDTGHRGLRSKHVRVFPRALPLVVQHAARLRRRRPARRHCSDSCESFPRCRKRRSLAPRMVPPRKHPREARQGRLTLHHRRGLLSLEPLPHHL